MYTIIELQTYGDETGNLVTTKSTLAEAESEFHRIMSAAAVSNVHYHACVVLDKKGKYVKSDFYEHIPEPGTVEVE